MKTTCGLDFDYFERCGGSKEVDKAKCEKCWAYDPKEPKL